MKIIKVQGTQNFRNLAPESKLKSLLNRVLNNTNPTSNQNRKNIRTRIGTDILRTVPESELKILIKVSFRNGLIGMDSFMAYIIVFRVRSTIEKKSDVYPIQTTYFNHARGIYYYFSYFLW